MAAKIITENKFARQDTFRVHPADVKPGRDSRVVPAPDQDAIDKKLAVSIITYGQKQPAPVRRDDEKKLVTVAGNTRHRAVQLILDGFEFDGVVYPPNPDARLWVVVEDLTDDEAFDAGVIENQDRTQTTDLQEAHAHDYYRTERGFNDTEIAKHYGYTNTNRVAALKNLLAAPEPVKQANHAGKLALDTALKIAKLPEEKQAEAIKKIEAGEKVTSGAIRKEANKEEDGVQKSKFEKRNVSDFKDFVAGAADNTDKTHEELLGRLVEWFAGKIGDKALWNTLDKYTKVS